MTTKIRWLQVSVAVITLLLSSVASIQWLAVGLKSGDEDISTSWGNLKGIRINKAKPTDRYRDKASAAFNKRQRKLLKQTVNLYYVLEKSAVRTIFSCQQAFNESRWNCSSLNQLPKLSPELNSGTREQAYVYALASARLTIDVGRACAAGVISGCPCQDKRSTRSSSLQGGFTSEGCAMSYKPGLKIAQRFINAGLKGRGKDGFKKNDQSLWTKKHNSKFGAQAVARAMEKKCKCHGLSASCDMKTCWRGVNEQVLLAELKAKYSSALTLQQNKVKDKGGGLDKRDLDDDSIEGLVFNKFSSDYCNPDPFSGSYGTQHRDCGGPHRNNCDWMCCGRGYTVNTVTRTERCHCKHVWCCYVQCDACNVSTITYRCN